MRLALLVMAFREPLPLRHALPVYRQAGYDVYVHLDRKADKAAYVNQLGSEAQHCQVIDHRYDVFWGGFSMIEAELALLAAARSAASYERFTLVSDDTFPIITASELRNHVMLPYDRIMIRLLQEDDPLLERYNNFFYFDHPVTSLLGRPIETAAITTEFLDEITKIQLLRRIGKKKMDVYYGSQWWSLTASTINRCVELIQKDQDIINSFRYSAVPDEIMFQSLVGNFIRRDRVRSGPVFVDWSRDPRPYIFSSRDGLPLPEAGFAFARKFSSSNIEFLNGFGRSLATLR